MRSAGCLSQARSIAVTRPFLIELLCSLARSFYVLSIVLCGLCASLEPLALFEGDGSLPSISNQELLRSSPPPWVLDLASHFSCLRTQTSGLQLTFLYSMSLYRWDEWSRTVDRGLSVFGEILSTYDIDLNCL